MKVCIYGRTSREEQDITRQVNELKEVVLEQRLDPHGHLHGRMVFTGTPS